MSAFAIKRPVFTLVTMFLILILGLVSLYKIPLKLIPDLNPPVGVIVASYPGASPEEVVEKVTKPLEDSLATLPGLKTMTATSQEGTNFIFLQFSWSTNIDDLQNDIVQRIDQANLPDDVADPKFLKFDPSQFPVIQLSLRTEQDENVTELKSLADQLKLELTKVNGVANVNLSGTAIKEVRVELDQKKLRQFKLSQSDIIHIIQTNNVSIPGNTVFTEDKELTTRIISTIDSMETLENLILAFHPDSGKKIKLKEVSKIILAKQDNRTITRTNQKPAVLLSVLQQSDANTAVVSNEFKKELEKQLKKKKYEGIKSDILFDQGDFVKQAIKNIGNSLILGGLFAMVVLFLFLRNVKSPLIIGIAIPYSVIFTFILMYFSNFTLNIMTLGGLALGIGMLVDNSIVVIENIFRHLSLGKEPKQAAFDGTKEIGGAITASTFTTIAVFLPVVFITGIIGELFTEFALTISFSLVASLIVALTVVPMLASRILKKPKVNHEARRRRSKSMGNLERAIKWALANRLIVLVTTIILLLVGVFGLTKIGTQFLPNSDEGFFTIRVNLENGSALSETTKVVNAIEKTLKNKKEVDVYVSLVGTTQESSFRGTGRPNIAEVYVKMKPLNKRNLSVFEFIDKEKKEIEKAALKENSTVELAFNLQATSGTSPNTLTFSIRDTNEKRLQNAVNNIEKKLRSFPELNELSTDISEKVEEIHLTVNREKALQNGLLPGQVAMVVAEITRGKKATQIIDQTSSEIYGVFVEYNQDITKNIDELRNVLINKPDGTFIPLKEITTITREKGPVSVQRINQQKAVQFTLKYKNTTTLGEISRKVDKQIKDIKLPEETEVVFSGDRELLESTIDDLIAAFILAVILIYLVMAAQFESLLYPFVIMFTVPLMVIGVAIALIITVTPLGLTAIIGIIVLAGIVVNNAIVIVDYINQRKLQGMHTYHAIIESVKDRARPILMTALTTILGLLPITIGIGEGTEMNQPMGIAVIGGLLSSTFLTLFVIPVIFSIFDKQTRKMNKKFATPNGHIVPAYLLEEKRLTYKKDDGIQKSIHSISTDKTIDVLEDLLKVLKKSRNNEK